MANDNLKSSTNRRRFLGSLASGAAAVGLATIAPTLPLHAKETVNSNDEDPEAWLKKINGKHRMVFDATHPYEIFPFAWPKVFLVTNASTGTPAKDCSVVVVLRHSAMGFALEDRLWEKYKLGEALKVDDKKTKAPAVRNPFWRPAKGDYMIPGVGAAEIGINELQDQGVTFVVCGMAILVNANTIAGKMDLDPEKVHKDLLSGVLPGIEIAPSGVWAIGRAQEHGCGYCFVG